MQEAIDKGWFRKERELTLAGSGIPDTTRILATALDIAEGVAFLHARGVVHGDLTGGTCTLIYMPPTSSQAEPNPSLIQAPFGNVMTLCRGGLLCPLQFRQPPLKV